MGRTAHVPNRPKVDHSDQMSERGLHTIEDDLSETWVEDWAAVGVAELEALLAKHAAFLGFLETVEDLRPRVCGLRRAEIARRSVKLEYLYRGFPGHPLHPPFTDATIGIYTFATIAAVLEHARDRRERGRARPGGSR